MLKESMFLALPENRTQGKWLWWCGCQQTCFCLLLSWRWPARHFHHASAGVVDFVCWMYWATSVWVRLMQSGIWSFSVMTWVKHLSIPASNWELSTASNTALPLLCCFS